MDIVKKEDINQGKNHYEVTLLGNIIEELNQVKRMVENGENCSDILKELANARNDINKVGKFLLRNNVENCIDRLCEYDNSLIVSIHEMLNAFMDD